jgi:hypothetical protein
VAYTAGVLILFFLPGRRSPVTSAPSVSDRPEPA